MNTISDATGIIYCIEDGKDEQLRFRIVHAVTQQFSDREVQSLFEAIDDRNADRKSVKEDSIELLREWGVPTLDVDRFGDDESDKRYLTRVLDSALLLLPHEDPKVWYERFSAGPKENGFKAQALSYLSRFDEQQHAGAVIMNIEVSSDDETVVSSEREEVTLSKIKIELHYSAEDFAYTFFAAFVCDLVVSKGKSAIRSGACREYTME
jgi:hypothetical protein